MHLLAFGRSADGRVALLPSDAVEIEAEQGCVESEPGFGDGRFTSGMPPPTSITSNDSLGAAEKLMASLSVCSGSAVRAWLSGHLLYLLLLE